MQLEQGGDIGADLHKKDEEASFFACDAEPREGLV